MQKSKILHLAGVYERYKCQLNDINGEAIAAYIQDINTAYDKILATGIKVEHVNIEMNSFEAFREAVTNQNTMYISTLFAGDSPFLNTMQNMRFRAVHDYIHYMYNLPFTFDGEVKAYKIQKYFHTSEISRKILYSEVVLQAAYCEAFGKFADVQKVIINY